jgi:hypothetical protein
VRVCVRVDVEKYGEKGVETKGGDLHVKSKVQYNRRLYWRDECIRSYGQAGCGAIRQVVER